MNFLEQEHSGKPGHLTSTWKNSEPDFYSLLDSLLEFPYQGSQKNIVKIAQIGIVLGDRIKSERLTT